MVTGSEYSGRVSFGALGVPGATVTATATGPSRTKLATITDASGIFDFPDLADGEWSIRVEMQCFAPLEQVVTAGPAAARREWRLELLPVSEMHAGAMPSAAAQQAIFRKTEVHAAAPAAAAAVPVRTDASAASAETAAELNQRAADGFLINGSANNGATSLFSLADAFGNARKGPASLYNGNIGVIFDNSALDARAYSFTGQDTPKPAYNHVTTVLALGGPIRIPHLLRNGPNLFVNYQWTRNRNADTQAGRMPTVAERNGDFSLSPVTLFNAATGASFEQNRIPESQIARQARALLNLYPLPNFNGNARYNYQIALIGVTHQDSLQSRVNKTISRKDQISGTLAYQNTRGDSENLFGFLDTTDSAGINTGINWRHNIGPRLSFSVGYQFSRMATRITPFFANRQNVSGLAGIAGNDQNPVNWGPPNLVFSSGIAGLSDAGQSFTRNQTSAWSVAAFWSRGRHNLYAGGDVRRQQFNLLSQQNARGTVTFTGGGGSGYDFADFLLGIPDTSAIAFGNADKYLRAWADDSYITDDWRISPGFTLNAGLRWEYGSPITELYGRLVNLDLAPRFRDEAPVVARDPVGAITGRKLPDSLVYPDKHGFQPRVAVSWRPFAATSTVVRAGYGMYYNTSVYQAIATQMAQQAPLSKSFSVRNSAANPFTLADAFNATPGGTPATFAIDPDFRPGFVHNWQLSIQRDLPGALVMTASYLGSKGSRGVQVVLPNTYPDGALNPCPACPAGFAYMTSNGNSTREAGQIQLRRRLQSGFTGSVQYTFSKAIDDSALGGRNQGASVIAQDWLNLRAERALSNFDQRHLLNLQVQYTTGMGIAGGALASGRLASWLKEWTVTTQVNAGTGFPLTPVYLVPVNGTGITGSIRPDYTGAPVDSAPAGLFLNPAAYTRPAPGRWGNAGRNSITGPGQFTLNASLGRTFRLRDRVSLDVRVDSTNALNHVSFLSWNTTITSAQFGLPVAAGAMRDLQTSVRARF